MPSDASTLMAYTPLIDEITRGKPRLGELMRYNALGTLQLILDFNVISNLDAIRAYSGAVTMYIKHEGSDNFKTWSEYQEIIRAFMKKVCINSELRKYYFVVEDGIQVLADHLWNEYYRRYPLWPSVGNTNEADIGIDITHSYTHAGNYVVVWNCLGFVNVKDSRPGGRYHAELSGDPVIRLITIETNLLRELENTIKVPSLEQAREKVDDLARGRGRRAQISWRDI